MKLLIAVVVSGWLTIHFTTPQGPGSYYLFSTCDGLTVQVEACGYVETETHVAFELPADQPHRRFFARFDPSPW